MLSGPTLAASGGKIFENLKMVAGDSKTAAGSLENSDDSCNLSAWLLKRKSGAKKSRFLSSTNSRFFTLDFGSQTLFYKHSESDKKVSQPISFRHIASVQALVDTVTEMADNASESQAAGQQGGYYDPQLFAPVQRTDSKTSLASSLRKRMPSFGTPRSFRAPKEQHGFVVGTTDKSLELLCSSKMEADQWIAALHKAMLLGRLMEGGRNGSELVRSDSSTANSSRPTTACSFSSSLANTNCSEASANPSPLSTRPLSGLEQSVSAQESPNLADAYVKSLQPAATTRTSAMLPPKVPKRPPVAKAKTEQSDREAEKEEEVTEYSVVDARLQDDNDAWGVEPPQNVSQSVPRYHDQSEGLSWQERLERLDFSDDEDDCAEDHAQDALPIRSTSNTVPLVAGTTSSDAHVTVDDLQPFTASDDLSDSDEE